MTTVDWLRVIDEAAALEVAMVQFIGGEPTLHPDLPRLVGHALDRCLAVEVFSNLVHVTDELWALFSRPGVSLATSYYSDDPAEHAAVTGRPSHSRTRTNIAEAVRLGVPLQAGVIDLGDGQRVRNAGAELAALGVTDIGYDRLRQVGRGVRDKRAGTEQLCGRCGDGVAAIRADQPVTARPCYPDCAPTCQPNCAPRCSPTCNPIMPVPFSPTRNVTPAGSSHPAGFGPAR